MGILIIIQTFLKKHPGDLLVVERITATPPPKRVLASTSWEVIVKGTTSHSETIKVFLKAGLT